MVVHKFVLTLKTYLLGVGETTVHAVQYMLQVCDQFSANFDVKFNSSKSVAVCIWRLLTTKVDN